LRSGNEQKGRSNHNIVRQKVLNNFCQWQIATSNNDRGMVTGAPLCVRLLRQKIVAGWWMCLPMFHNRRLPELVSIPTCFREMAMLTTLKKAHWT